MDKYKICPSCGTKNGPTLLECVSCEADLTGVKLTDEETERQNTEKSEAEPQPKKPLQRICACGAVNPPNARKCSACGEDISDIAPGEVSPEQKTAYFLLSSLDGKFKYKVEAGQTVIGREGAMSEYLAGKSFVSRTHAGLSLENGALYIENLSNTNFTYVNGQRISAKIRLRDGDELGLGGTSFNGKRQSDAAYFYVRYIKCI